MNLEIIIESREMQLRLTTPADLEYVIETERHADNREYVFAWDLERHLEAINNENELHLIIQNHEKKRIGYMILRGCSDPNDSIELTRVSISNKGHGYGKQAIRLIQEYVFLHLQAHRLWLDVKETNSRAKHVYESAGFVVEGTLRECIKTNGAYESLTLMGILNSEFQCLSEKECL